MITATETLKDGHCLGLLALFLLLVPLCMYMMLTKKRRYGRKEVDVCFQRASRFLPEAVPSHLDTVVIGSGPGACTAANLLARSGQKVLILERHQKKTGGGTHSFRYQGCEWDTGLHYSSTAMSQKTSRVGSIMHFMTNGQQQFATFPEPYDEVFFPDHTAYKFMNGKKKTIDALLGPEESELKERVATFMSIYSDIHSGMVGLGLSRILPSWLHFFVKSRLDTLKKYGAMTVRDAQYAVLALGYSKDRLLQEGCPKAPGAAEIDPKIRRLMAVLAHPIGDYGTQPREASLAAHGVTAEHYIDGGSYTVGPTQNISINLTSVVRSCGGEALVDATVRSIVIEKGRAVGVRVSNTSVLEEMGESAPTYEIRAKNVICGTSAYNLYNSLLPRDLKVVEQFFDPKERTIRQSNGHLFVFCKISGDPDELALPDHNIWVFNGDDLDAAFDDFYANPTLARPPIVYIGFPCTKDTTWKKRFPGLSNCIVISDGLYEWFEHWRGLPVRHRGEDYDSLKEKLTKSLLDVLYEFVPQVKGKIEFYHLATPVTEESYLGCFRGGAYDTLCTPDMFAPVNQKWITTPRTPIPGLHVAGSSAFFPGLTGSLYGGCLCACSVLGYSGTLRLGLALLTNLAKSLKENDKKMGWIQAYRLAFYKFVKE